MGMNRRLIGEPEGTDQRREEKAHEKARSQAREEAEHESLRKPFRSLLLVARARRPGDEGHHAGPHRPLHQHHEPDCVSPETKGIQDGHPLQAMCL